MGEDETDPFDAAFDQREERRILSEIDMSFRRAGLAVEQAENQRVATLIDREQRYRVREQDRQLAEHELREGVFVNLSDTVVEPTEEWLQHGAVRRFTPRQPKGTVRTVSTVRRVVTPIIVRMYQADKLTEEQVRACLWYREIYEYAGMEGAFCSSAVNLVGQTDGSKRQGGAAGHIPITMEEAYSRQILRQARAIIPDQLLKFFEAIVVHDIALRRATRFARCSNNRAPAYFRRLADLLAAFCEREKVDLKGIERN